MVMLFFICIWEMDPGRGMLIYVISELKYSQINLSYCSDFSELISLGMLINRADKLLLTSIYRSPSLPTEDSLKLNNRIRNIMRVKIHMLSFWETLIIQT